MSDYFYIGNGILRTSAGDITEGQKIPAGCLGSDEIEHLLAENLISGDKPVAPVAPVVAAPKPEFPTGWNWDVNLLVGKTLEELNTLIADHAERLKEETPEPFDTIEEAAAYLTSEC